VILLFAIVGVLGFFAYQTVQDNNSGGNTPVQQPAPQVPSTSSKSTNSGSSSGFIANSTNSTSSGSSSMNSNTGSSSTPTYPVNQGSNYYDTHVPSSADEPSTSGSSSYQYDPTTNPYAGTNLDKPSSSSLPSSNPLNFEN